MATVFGHACLALGIGYVQNKTKLNWLIVRSMIYCSLIPDLDVLAFKFGIPYESVWGHRGFSHSLVFGIFLGLVVTAIINLKSRDRSFFLFGYG